MKVILSLIDFPSWTYGGPLLALLVLAVLALVLIALFATALFQSPFEKREDNNIRIYTYDYARKTFSYFDRQNPRHQRTMNEHEFFHQFQPSDSYQVKNWLAEVVSGTERKTFLQADVKIQRKNRSLPSILELKSVNHEKSVIHFESHLLSFTTTSPALSRKKRIPHMLTSNEEAEDYLMESDPNRLTAVYGITFYSREKTLSEKTYQEINKIAKSSLPVLSAYLGKERKLLALSESEFLLLDLQTMSKAMAMQIASSLETKLRQNINQLSPDTTVDFAIGLSTGSFYQKDFQKAKEQSHLMAEAIVRKEDSGHILFYDQDFFRREQKKRQDKKDLDQLIRNKTFRLYFLPSLDLRSYQESFYLLDIRPYGTTLSAYEDVLRLAQETKGKAELLIQGILEKLSEVLPSDRRISILAPINYSALPLFSKVLKSNDNRRFDLILALRESDLLPFLPSLRQVMESLLDLKKRGFHFAIHIANASSLLPNKLLMLFSYIFVGKEFTHDLESPTATNQLQLIEADYKKLGLPLVYAGLEGLSQVELCAHYGGDIFLSPGLGDYSSRPEKINPDSIEELRRSLT